MTDASAERDFRERTKVVFDPDEPASLEQYRTLALTLERSAPRDTGRVLVVTSALAGEGKTLTVTNLGLTLSDSFGRRVLLIDGDVRNPSLHSVFESRGIFEREAARDEAVPADVHLGMTLGQVTPTFMVLGVLDGPASDPVRVLNSPDLKRLVTWARERFDWVLIDSPPALVPDSAILAQLADGVLFVVSSGSTPFDAAKQAVDNIGRDRIIGAVMNRADSGDGNRALEYVKLARSGHRQR